MTIHLVTKIIEVRDYTLVCQFGSGEIIEYDMNDIQSETGSMAQPLKDPQYFARVFLESGTPTWPNGYDVCPETIYQQGRRQSAA